MARLDDEIESLIGPMPTRAAMAMPAARQDEYARLKNWEAKRDAVMSQIVPQMLNPARGMNLGQLSNISGIPAEDIASPDQYRTVNSPSEVPSYRYVPTMAEEPQLREVEAYGPGRPQTGIVQRQVGVPANPQLVPPTFDIDKIQRPDNFRQRNDAMNQAIMTMSPQELHEGAFTDMLDAGKFYSRQANPPLPNEDDNRVPATVSVFGDVEGPRPTNLVNEPRRYAVTPQVRLPGAPESRLDFGLGDQARGLREQQPVGTFQEAPRPQVSTRELDRNAPTDLPQQLLAQAVIKRESTWPRNYGSQGQAGTNTFNAKVRARAEGLMASDPTLTAQEAMSRAQLELTGGTTEQIDDKTANLRTRTDTSASRGRNLDAQTDMLPRRQAEVERHNRVMESLRRDSLSFQDRWHEQAQQALSNKDEVAWARLNEQRYWHDQMMAWAAGVDKSGVLTEEQEAAGRQGLDVVRRMETREPTPDELGFLERLTGKTRPRYTLQPRPEIRPQGQPPSMQRNSAPGVTGSGSSRQAQSSSSASKLSRSSKLATVNSQEEYDALPKGTEYVDSEGNKGRKQ